MMTSAARPRARDAPGPAGDAGEDAGSAQVGQLGREESDAPGSGVDEDGIAGLDRVVAADEVLGGEALHQQAGGGVVVDVVRNGYGLAGGQDQFSV
jgi:hypothetical protein